MLLAVADENPFGKITVKDFIPVGIDQCKTFLARNKMMAKQQIYTKDIDVEAMKLMFVNVNFTQLYLTRQFRKVDTEDAETKQRSGFVSFKVIKDVFCNTSLLTTKETNLLLREFAMKYGFDRIPYETIGAELVDVRSQLLNNRTTGIHIEKYPVAELMHGLTGDSRQTMTIQELRTVLYRCKKLVLTPLQIAVLIGFANPGAAGIVDVQAFNKVMRSVILGMFTFEPTSRKASMLQQGLFKNSDVKMPQFEDMGLFKVFRDFDEDGKGFLDPTEFYRCLESYKPLELKPSEITTMTLLCDCDMNMRIDYAQAMTFFREFLFQMRFIIQLQEKFEEELSREKGE
jgi:hypothetical protein